MNKKHDINKVLEIGDKLFREKGYHNTGTDDILKMANYPRSSFYHRFKSKEGFAEKTVEYYGAYIKSLLESKLEDNTEPNYVQRLKNYFYMIADYNEENNFKSCCLVQKFTIEIGEIPNNLLNKTLEQFESWKVVVEKCIKLGQKEGQIRIDKESSQLTELVYTTLYGAYTLARLSRKRGYLKNELNKMFELLST
ncbi:MAG: TetR/AcrR family transcriptional regulator [Flavobacteriales bacterium]|nr:TetR/AcrR family transcriptional regulator [Flavobacteriales bacterium]